MSDKDQQIVVTGMGVISPIGNDVASFQQNLFAGMCGIDIAHYPYRDKDITYPAALVKNFDAALHMDPKKINLMDRFAQFAVAAARQAYQDSGLNLTEDEAQRTGVIVGTGVGGQHTLEESYTNLFDPNGKARIHPFTVPRLMVNAGASHISMDIGITGPAFTVASACASAIHAMGVAIHLLRSGMIDKVITGGAESCLSFGCLKGWEALRVMAPDLCRPFSANRTGMVLGEGAAMFVLEKRLDAEKRGAKIYATCAGFGMSSDAKDLTSPDVVGATRAMQKALIDAHVTPDEVDYINAHGTGTRINDRAETEAIKQAFGTRAQTVPISSSKSMFGHALGAAGALEMLATISAVQSNIVPPTINYEEPDPECDLDYTPNQARPTLIKTAINNSFAFGGLNAVLVVQKE